MEQLIALLPEWEVYATDHRGTGRSSCLTDIGPDLDAYTMSAAARDVGYLIDATADPSLDVFVFGSSYGSEWAHRYVQIFPDQATGVILDSLAVNYPYSKFDLDFNLVAEQFMAYCANDSLCTEKLGDDPWGALGLLLTSLDSSHCPGLMDRASLRGLFSTMMYFWEVRQVIPAIIYRLQRCAPEDVTAIRHLQSHLTDVTFPPARIPRRAHTERIRRRERVRVGHHARLSRRSADRARHQLHRLDSRHRFLRQQRLRRRTARHR